MNSSVTTEGAYQTSICRLWGSTNVIGKPNGWDGWSRAHGNIDAFDPSLILIYVPTTDRFYFLIFPTSASVRPCVCSHYPRTSRRLGTAETLAIVVPVAGITQTLTSLPATVLGK